MLPKLLARGAAGGVIMPLRLRRRAVARRSSTASTPYTAALQARRRRLIAIHVTEAAATRLASEIVAAGLTPRLVTTEELSRRLGTHAVHQGLLLEAGPIEPIDLGDIEDRSGLVLVLDQITDPHNVGAIVRTAAAFGVDALVTTTRHTPDFSGIVAKAASGGLDHVPIAEVVNLARALDELGSMGYWRHRP